MADHPSKELYRNAAVLEYEARKAADAERIEAANLLCKFMTENLAEGWEVRLVMNSEECSLEIIDSDGEEHHPDTGEYGVCGFRQICEYTHERNKEHGDEEGLSEA